MPDSYHTCYTLAGLSSVQHLHYHIGQNGTDSTSPTAFQWRSVPLSDPAGGSTGEKARRGEGNGSSGRTAQLEPFHPLFVIAHQAAQKMRDWSEEQSRISPFGQESRV
jgi:protein farnesyltransferase subunit beta